MTMGVMVIDQFAIMLNPPLSIVKRASHLKMKLCRLESYKVVATVNEHMLKKKKKTMRVYLK